MTYHHVIRFAYHGVSDSKNPSNCNLHLTGNHTRERGTITLGSVRLKKTRADLETRVTSYDFQLPP